MPNVSRGELLQILESIQPGLTTRDVVEFSSCFVFKDGDVSTFNDEIACHRTSPLDIEGAVQATPLLNVLRRMPEETVDVTIEEGQMIVRGKKRRAGIRMQTLNALPIEKVESAEEWRTLHADFTDAIYVAQQCVGKDESNYATTCIHIHPKFVEACDNHQAIRYALKTRVRQPILVRGTSVKHIVSLDMTEVAETDTWIHFRNPTGLILSCRRDVQEYDDLESILTVDGVEFTLPKGLAKAAESAEIFSSENADANEVLVDIKPGRVKVTGEGSSGWYQEIKNAAYDGEPIQFRVAPKLLVELVNRYSDCVITADRLKVDTGKFVYVVALGKPETSETKEATTEATGGDVPF